MADIDPDALTIPQFKALAEELIADIPGARVEFQVTSHDAEGNWIWIDGTVPFLWSNDYRGEVRYRARIVSDWISVR